MDFNVNNVGLKISAGLPSQFPRDGKPQIAFSGRSNVGKSSLLNLLVNRKSLARVSGEPGKTITINFYEVDKKFYLVDLPGYGFAKRSFESIRKWSSLTDGYFTDNPRFDSVKLVVQLVDSRIGFTADDERMLSYLRENAISHIIVATKSDKLNSSEKRQAEKTIREHPLSSQSKSCFLFSSKTGEGKADVWRQIESAIIL